MLPHRDPRDTNGNDTPFGSVPLGLDRLLVHVARWKGWTVLSAVLALLVAAQFVYFSLTRPSIDWDTVPYTMAILKGPAFETKGVLDAPALHAATWATLKPWLTPDLLAYMTEGDYRIAQYTQPAALVSQLPLFESKYGYVLALKAVASFTSPVQAIILASLVGALGTLAIVFAAAVRLDGIASLALAAVRPPLQAAELRQHDDTRFADDVPGRGRLRLPARQALDARNRLAGGKRRHSPRQPHPQPRGERGFRPAPRLWPGRCARGALGRGLSLQFADERSSGLVAAVPLQLRRHTGPS
jgi:hypothetical protein